MKENYKVRSTWKTPIRAKIGFPLALLSCSLFFFAGFFASMLFSQDVPSEGVGIVRRLEELGSDWPTMPHGVTGESHASSIPFQVLSWKPRALYLPNSASPEKCDAIVRLAKTKLRPSTLALRKGETEETTKGIRTSSGTFLSASQDPSGSLAWVEKKIAKVTMIPREHGEPFNVLRYELGQHYASHYDAFNPAEYGPQQSQRVAIFLLYLSDVEEGGETMFPFENGANMDIGYDYEKCIGLKVKPRKGDGLLFYSLMNNGTIDPPLNEWFAAVFNYVTIVISLVRRIHPAMYLMALALRKLREGNGLCRILIFLLDCARVSSNEKDGTVLYTSCELRAKSAMQFLVYLSKAANRIKCYAEVQLCFSPVAIKGDLACVSRSEWFCNLINTEQVESLHPLNNCVRVDVTA